MYKICSKCKEDKIFSAFSRNKARTDGYDNQCKICIKEYQSINKEQISNYNKEYYKANKTKISAEQKEYRKNNRDLISNYLKANKELITAYRKDYYEANKTEILDNKKHYRRVNKDRYTALAAKRRASKLKATPMWLTNDDLEQIKELYTIAQMFKIYTGQEYHVDHIVPLQGKNVCGLHVPWNLQVISAKENRDKSNKLLEE